MLKRIDLSRDYIKHKKEYLEAIQRVCEGTAFSGENMQTNLTGNLPGI